MNIDDSAIKKALGDIKQDYIDQITEDFVESPYQWQKKMTIVNMIIITIGKGKEYPLYKYDNFCRDILNYSENSFDEARMDGVITSSIEFGAIFIKHNGDIEKMKEEMTANSMEKLKKAFLRLEKIMLKKMLKKIIKEDYLESHDKFIEDYYGKREINTQDFFNYLKSNHSENKS